MTTSPARTSCTIKSKQIPIRYQHRAGLCTRIGRRVSERDCTSTKVTWLTIKTGEDEDASLAEGEDDRKELLRSLVEFPIGLEVEVDVDEMCTWKCQIRPSLIPTVENGFYLTRKELEDHPGRDDGCRAQFHQSPSV